MDAVLESRIEKALDTIRPYLAADGGDVKIVGIENETLVLELVGNCSSCPMSSMTLKAGVEEAVKREVHEIKRVIALNSTDPENTWL